MAVDFCHSMGIPVRDLRPHNLLLLEPNDAPSLCRCAHMPSLHAHVSTELARFAVSSWAVRDCRGWSLAVASHNGNYVVT